MAIYDILTTHKDQRDGGDICSFNGYLEDYLGMIEEDETKRLRHSGSCTDWMRISGSARIFI